MAAHQISSLRGSTQARAIHLEYPHAHTRPFIIFRDTFRLCTLQTPHLVAENRSMPVSAALWPPAILP